MGESIEERGVTESSWASLPVATLVLTARVVLRRIVRQKEKRKEKKVGNRNEEKVGYCVPAIFGFVAASG